MSVKVLGSVGMEESAKTMLVATCVCAQMGILLMAAVAQVTKNLTCVFLAYIETSWTRCE